MTTVSRSTLLLNKFPADSKAYIISHHCILRIAFQGLELNSLPPSFFPLPFPSSLFLSLLPHLIFFPNSLILLPQVGGGRATPGLDLNATLGFRREDSRRGDVRWWAGGRDLVWRGPDRVRPEGQVSRVAISHILYLQGRYMNFKDITTNSCSNVKLFIPFSAKLITL